MIMFEYRTGGYVMTHIGTFLTMFILSTLGFLTIVFWLLEHVRFV